MSCKWPLLLLMAGLAGCDSAPRPDASWATAELATPAGPGSAQAHLAAADSVTWLSWLEPESDGGHALRYARLEGEAFAAPRTIARGDDWFVNWADFPSVVPLGNGRLFAHWLQLQPEQRYAYDIVYAVSVDSGGSWSAPQTLNADGLTAEHGFLSFFTWGEDVGAVWLDGREVAALSMDEYLEVYDRVGMTLRFARFDSAGNVLERGELDELVCDCCQTDAVSVDGVPIVVYRDRQIGEQRDIVVRRFGDGQWSEGVQLGPDNWVIDACPVNGPAVAALGAEVGVAWFTAADNLPRVRFARSGDAGAQFSAPLDIGPNQAFGQVDLVMADGGVAYLSFWRRGAEVMELAVQKIVDLDLAGDPRVVAVSAESLPVDVPQMVLDGGELVVAWSTLTEPAGVFAVRAPLW